MCNIEVALDTKLDLEYPDVRGGEHFLSGSKQFRMLDEISCPY